MASILVSMANTRQSLPVIYFNVSSEISACVCTCVIRSSHLCSFDMNVFAEEDADLHCASHQKLLEDIIGGGLALRRGQIQ